VLLARWPLGGGPRGYNPSGDVGRGALAFATGPINFQACLQSGRGKQASVARCDAFRPAPIRELSPSVNAAVARVFDDPHILQRGAPVGQQKRQMISGPSGSLRARPHRLLCKRAPK